MLANMLDLSTAHMPCERPNFGKLRHSENEYGFVVWVTEPFSDDPLTEWLKPIMDVALERRCVLINFDRDADSYPSFRTYEW